MERNILGSCLQDASTYRVVSKCNLHSTFSDAGKIVWGIISKYYEKDPDADCVDFEIFKKQLERQYPKHHEELARSVNVDEVLSAPNIAEEVINLTKDNIRLELIAALGTGDEKTIDNLMERWNGVRDVVSGEDTTVYNATSALELVQRESEEFKFKVIPKALNEHLGGGLKPQHHVLVYALTDMGKTLFTINLSYGFAFQGYRVGYFGNEDPGGDLMMRYLIRCSGMTKQEIINDPEAADEAARANGYDNFFLFEMAPGTPAEIEAAVKEHDLQIIIVDQVRNLNMREDHKVSQMEKAATAMRNIGKRNNILVISVSQAADSASGKAILGRGDVDSSNVGLPGQVDLMLGIGATEDMELQGRRTVSFAKNKVSGNKQPLPVVFDYTRMRVE